MGLTWGCRAGQRGAGCAGQSVRVSWVFWMYGCALCMCSCCQLSPSSASPLFLSARFFIVIVSPSGGGEEGHRLSSTCHCNAGRGASTFFFPLFSSCSPLGAVYKVFAPSPSEWPEGGRNRFFFGMLTTCLYLPVRVDSRKEPIWKHCPIEGIDRQRAAAHLAPSLTSPPPLSLSLLTYLNRCRPLYYRTHGRHQDH